MADTITSTAIDGFSTRWGTIVYDYKLNSVPTDFQDLMVAISEHRATAVEGEVKPLSTRMRARNANLDIAGSLLSIFSATQAQFKNDDSGGTEKDLEGEITRDQLFILEIAYRMRGGTHEVTYNWANTKWTKASVEGMIQALKSLIDSMNNSAQTDMTRLQSLVDRRDESFTTATTLMTNVSDTRSNAIRNM